MLTLVTGKLGDFQSIFHGPLISWSTSETRGRPDELGIGVQLLLLIWHSCFWIPYNFVFESIIVTLNCTLDQVENKLLHLEHMLCKDSICKWKNINKIIPSCFFTIWLEKQWLWLIRSWKVKLIIILVSIFS